MYNGTTSSYTYGADGLRRRSVTGANTPDYVLDGQSAVRTLLNGAVDKTWFHGARGPEYERTGSGSPPWYLYDGLGSVLGTVDGSGNLVNTRKYDVYGAVRASTAGSGPTHKFVGALGHPSDDETGLVYMRARYMDPVTGRFSSEDPDKVGGNWYEYALSNPARYSDASGKNPIDMLWKAATAAYGVIIILLLVRFVTMSAQAARLGGTMATIYGLLGTFGAASLVNGTWVMSSETLTVAEAEQLAGMMNQIKAMQEEAENLNKIRGGLAGAMIMATVAYATLCAVEGAFGEHL